MLASAGARVPSVPGLRGIHVLIRDAGCAAPLRTDDDALVQVTYGGRWIVPEDVRDRIGDPATRHLVDPSRSYFRTTPVFETGARNYLWLNDIVCVGSGYPVEGGIACRYSKSSDPRGAARNPTYLRRGMTDPVRPHRRAGSVIRSLANYQPSAAVRHAGRWLLVGDCARSVRPPGPRYASTAVGGHAHAIDGRISTVRAYHGAPKRPHACPFTWVWRTDSAVPTRWPDRRRRR
ncbi:DUF3237 family protein [Nocardia beijingensis]|uniref:DUF3237 family protein n=1 Tax=Nocardia beijingensis TaxID=95162 RepID=UPI0033F4A8BF